MRHIHIPVFVPHLGCPHTCVFCNQHSITGQDSFSVEEFHRTVENTLATCPKDARKEIAFFGGSFTAIDRELMVSLLSLAKGYVDENKVDAIRLSTRPDAIDSEIIAILKAYPVSTIELGIQSTSDEVLMASERGHTAEDAQNACRLLKRHGFLVVGQMMSGLPLSTYEKEKKTAEDMIAWGVDAVRIYPTVVFPDTTLDDMRKRGVYTPLSPEEAAQRVGGLLELFYDNGIDVIRVGLCETDLLHNTQNISGAYHPALGELCQSEFFRRRIEKSLDSVILSRNTEITVEVATASLSQAIGQKQSNLIYFKSKYPVKKFTVKSSFALGKKEVKIYTKEN